MRIEEVRWKAEECANESRRSRTGGYLVACVLIALFSVGLFVTGAPRAKAGSAMIVAGAAFIVWCFRRSRSGEVPIDAGFNDYRHFYRAEREHQGDLLRRVRYWYLGAVLPGIVLILIGSTFYAYDVLMYLFLAAELIRRAIERRRVEIDPFGSAN